MRILGYLGLLTGIAVGAFGQPAPAPKFEIADVHVSPKAPNPFVRVTPPRNGRYEIHNATMVDLVRTAYDFDADKVLGGPHWLEMDRFDILAKLPAGTPSVSGDTGSGNAAPPNATPEALKPMLQALLADRFKLVVHKESRPLPTYALMAGKKPQLKEADGAGDTGCRMQTSSSAPTDGGPRTMIALNGSGPIVLGPGMTIQYNCRNMTMEAFAAGLRTMLGANVGNNPVMDKTNLAGRWNFDVKWSLQLNGGPAGDTTERISVFDAVEKQLGLKLEQQPVSTPVMVVDSVNEVPSPNPPGVAEALPVIPTATTFEVADIKPTDPDYKGGNMRTQNGRVTAQGMPMQSLLRQAFQGIGGMMGGSDAIAGIPKWTESARFDINAKAPADTPTDFNSTGPMLRALLEDRFKLKTHTEDRPVNAYTLVAAKPKMKKADPASRTHCIQSNAPAGSPPGTQVLTCQNITMEQFADRLRGMDQALNWPVLDKTGIDGGWDFVLTYGRGGLAGPAGGGRGGEGGPAPSETAMASDPSGTLTIFEAVEKQLGLKLEMQKRPMPIIVIDHLEEKPTEN